MILNTKYKTSLCRNFEQSVGESDQTCHMEDKCHFAHGKGELRMVSDPLPDDTPYINDQKLMVLNNLGIACLADNRQVRRQLKELGRPH